MKLTEDKLRRIIREELQFKSGETVPPRGTANRAVHDYLKRVVNRLASQLQSAYEIDFEPAIESNMAFTADFEIYNNRQDVMYEGRLTAFRINEEIKIEAQGGRLGTSIPEWNSFLNKRFDMDENPVEQLDIVSSFQILAGR